jgi:uncharacterized protein
MIRKIQLRVDPETAATPRLLAEEIRREAGLAAEQPAEHRVTRRSIDARGRNIRVNLTVELATGEPLPAERIQIEYKNVSGRERSCHIIGAGPAGLFAALRCLELGIRPVMIERGKDVRARRRDLAAINKEGVVNPESNYCFGEGGAGTYSDGKLYTRSTKRGDTEKVLRTFVFHGASEEIMIDAHPHIGTNKLPKLIENIRETILRHGGEIQFNTRLDDLSLSGGRVKAIVVSKDGVSAELPVEHLIIATGHSARDIYELLHRKHLQLESKPFALGVRAEHPQALIDGIQYHCRTIDEVSRVREFLPAASYSLVQQVKGRGVYSFCMCPGGIIAPCATSQEEVVTNGWSPSKRNNPYANSGIVVELKTEDFSRYASRGPLAGLAFQQEVERRAWEHGGRTQTAPAQRLVDFIRDRASGTLPPCSYQPGIKSADLRQVLGPMIASALKEGLKAFGGTMRGYLSEDAVLVATESRTSTPVRIPRDRERLHHPQAENLYPCGEGAGYAGGIMSAAMDGERCAEAAVKAGD